MVFFYLNQTETAESLFFPDLKVLLLTKNELISDVGSEN